jgi:hypothetical protein
MGHTERKSVCEQSADLAELQLIIRHEISDILIQHLKRVTRNILSCELSIRGEGHMPAYVFHFLNTLIHPPPSLQPFPQMPQLFAKKRVHSTNITHMKQWLLASSWPV